MEKIIKTDFNEYDYMTKYEKIIEQNPNFLEYSTIDKNAKTPEEKILYILTILTILYKEYTYKKYSEQISSFIQTDNSKKELVIELNQKLKDELIRKNYKNIYIILLENKNRITKYIRKYFKRKRINYIQEKKALELIISKTKKILEINPYMINQLIQYYQNPLSEQEKIIADIIEFLKIADKITKKDNIYTLRMIKALMLHKYQEQELNDAIMFIISDVYQEAMQNPKDPNFKLIKEILENEEIYTNEQIIEIFIVNHDFSNAMLSSFLYYNISIKEGRLEELKQNPSYEYVKKRTQK